jgi:hypothetical protein
MQGVTTLGLDIAMSVFQVHSIDAIVKVVNRITRYSPVDNQLTT